MAVLKMGCQGPWVEAGKRSNVSRTENPPTSLDHLFQPAGAS